MGANGARRATRAIGALFAIPALFYLDTALLLEHEPLVGFARAVADTHVFLPFLILAAISIFPLTLLECLLITVLVLAAKALTVLLSEYAGGSALLGSFWLLLLVAGVSTLASVGQLAGFIILIRQAVRDLLTGCFSRRSGEELLEVQFALSSRSRSPLSLAYVGASVCSGRLRTRGRARRRATVPVVPGRTHSRRVDGRNISRSNAVSRRRRARLSSRTASPARRTRCAAISKSGSAGPCAYPSTRSKSN